MSDLPTRAEIANVVRPFFFHYDDRIERMTDAFMEFLARRAQNKSESAPSD